MWSEVARMHEASFLAEHQPLFMVAYKNVRTGACWREVRLPGYQQCRFERIPGRPGELILRPAIDQTQWENPDMVVIVNEAGLIIAGWPGHIECDKDGPRLEDWR